MAWQDRGNQGGGGNNRGNWNGNRGNGGNDQRNSGNNRGGGNNWNGGNRGNQSSGNQQRSNYNRNQGGGGNYPGNRNNNNQSQRNQEIPQIAGINRGMIVGYVESFEAKWTPNGLAIFNGKIAVPYPFGRDGAWGKNTFTVVAFEKLAEDIGNTIQEGAWVKIVGQMKNRGYKDNDGNMKWQFQVNIEKFEFVDPNNNFAVVGRPSATGPANDHNDDAPVREPIRRSAPAQQDYRDSDLDGLREIEGDPDPDA